MVGWVTSSSEGPELAWWPPSREPYREQLLQGLEEVWQYAGSMIVRGKRSVHGARRKYVDSADHSSICDPCSVAPS